MGMIEDILDILNFANVEIEERTDYGKYVDISWGDNHIKFSIFPRFYHRESLYNSFAEIIKNDPRFKDVIWACGG